MARRSEGYGFTTALVCTLLVVGTTSCSAGEGGAGVENRNVTRVSDAAGSRIKLAVGEMDGCTIIATDIPSFAQGLYIGVGSAHCLSRELNQCWNKTITWSGKTGDVKCMNVAPIEGEGAGDYVLLELDRVPPSPLSVDVALQLAVDERLVIHRGNGETAGDCKATSTAPSAFEHNCLGSGSSGWSGSAIFKLVGAEKQLVGMHVSQTPAGKQASAWPTRAIANHRAGVRPSVSRAVAQTSTTKLCRDSYQRFLLETGKVATQPNVEAFLTAAHAASTKAVFDEFLASRYLPHTHRIDCGAAGGVDGRGLVKSSDSVCSEGEWNEKCEPNCCKLSDGGFGGYTSRWEDVCLDWKDARQSLAKPLPVCGR